MIAFTFPEICYLARAYGVSPSLLVGEEYVASAEDPAPEARRSLQARGLLIVRDDADHFHDEVHELFPQVCEPRSVVAVSAWTADNSQTMFAVVTDAIVAITTIADQVLHFARTEPSVVAERTLDLMEAAGPCRASVQVIRDGAVEKLELSADDAGTTTIEGVEPGAPDHVAFIEGWIAERMLASAGTESPA